MRTKPFTHLPVTTPWKYDTPVARPNITKKKTHASRLITTKQIENKATTNMNLSKASQDSRLVDKCEPRDNRTAERAPERPAAAAARCGDAQYQHFMRLMQLFPGVHPAYIHTLLNNCKNDFFEAVDSLLRSKTPPRHCAPGAAAAGAAQAARAAPVSVYAHPLPVRLLPRPGLIKINANKQFISNVRLPVGPARPLAGLADKALVPIKPTIKVENYLDFQAAPAK